MKLNKLEEAENTLLNKKYSQSKHSRDDRTNDKHIPNGAAGCYLLGLVHHKKDKEREACRYFTKALELDPTLWCAFEKLATYDQHVKFTDRSLAEVFNFNQSASKTPSRIEDDNSNETKENKHSTVDNKGFICSPIHERDSEDPQEHYTPTRAGLNPNYVTPTATGKSSRRLNTIGNNAPQQLHHESKLGGMSPNSKAKEAIESSIGGHLSGVSDGYPRPITSTSNENVIKPFKVTTPSVVGNQSLSKSSISPKFSKANRDYLDNYDLMWLLRKLGSAYIKQIKYACSEAIQEYNELPETQFKTGWVLNQIGQCYLDTQEYNEAEKIYLLMRKLEPYTIEGLQYYSICLWHLKKQVELCSLSNFVLKKNTLASETWIVVGN